MRAVVTLSAITLVAACASQPEWRVRSSDGMGAAGAAARVEPPRATTASESAASSALAPEEGVAWRFDVGAPPAGAPAIDDAGAVYVATTDGYLHCIEPDGRFRWSYTLSSPAASGPMLLRPGAAARGRAATADPAVIVATSSGDVYALETTGAARWIYRAKVAVVTPLAIDERGQIHFGARDRNVHAISPGGGGRWRAEAFNAITSGPVVARDRTLAVATRTPKLVLTRGVLWRRAVRLDAPVLAPLSTDGERVYAVAGRKLHAVTSDGEVAWTYEGVDGGVTPWAHGVVATSERRVLWLDASGTVRGSAALDDVPSAPPVVLDGGSVIVAQAGGRLSRVDPDGTRASLPWGEPAAHVVSNDASGRVVAISAMGRVGSAEHAAFRRAR